MILNHNITFAKDFSQLQRRILLLKRCWWMFRRLKVYRHSMVPIPPPLRRMAPYDIILVTYSATSLLDLLVAHDLVV